MRKINYIVLHCTAGPQTQTVESIKNHWKHLGWKSVGYHRLIAADGTIHNLADYSVPTNGVQGFNSQSIHISYIGGVKDGRPVDNRTDAQKGAMERLVREAHGLFPNAAIVGHRDFSPDKNRDGIIQENEWIKACPSFSVKTWLNDIGFKSDNKKPALRTIAKVNLREGAGTSFPALEVLNVNTTVQYIAQSEGWTMVNVNGKKGWIMSQYLK